MYDPDARKNYLQNPQFNSKHIRAHRRKLYIPYTEWIFAHLEFKSYRNGFPIPFYLVGNIASSSQHPSRHFVSARTNKSIYLHRHTYTNYRLYMKFIAFISNLIPFAYSIKSRAYFTESARATVMHFTRIIWMIEWKRFRIVWYTYTLNSQ